MQICVTVTKPHGAALKIFPASNWITGARSFLEEFKMLLSPEEASLFRPETRAYFERIRVDHKSTRVNEHNSSLLEIPPLRVIQPDGRVGHRDSRK